MLGIGPHSCFDCTDNVVYGINFAGITATELVAIWNANTRGNGRAWLLLRQCIFINVIRPAPRSNSSPTATEGRVQEGWWDSVGPRKAREMEGELGGLSGICHGRWMRTTLMGSPGTRRRRSDAASAVRRRIRGCRVNRAGRWEVLVLPDFRRWGGIIGSVNLGNVWVPKWIPGLPRYNPSVINQITPEICKWIPRRGWHAEQTHNRGL